MRFIDKIIIHTADTKPSMDIGVKEIRDWHIKRGWNDVGYHFIIRKNGHIEKGRDIDIVGSHCYGKNKSSIGICWVGGYGGVDDRNDAQKESLIKLIKSLKTILGGATLHGHNQFSSKTCPNFNVIDEYSNL